MNIRDIDKAVADFQSLPLENKERTENLEYISILRGEKESNMIASMRNINTDIGMIPLEFYIGPLKLASPFHKK
jgi:hypothetical protein